MKLNKNRTLRLESLETRTLLSATGLGYTQPTGMGGEFWTDTFSLEAGAQRDIEFDSDVVVFSTDSTGTKKTLTPSSASVSTKEYTLYNDQTETIDYTLIAYRDAVLEKELSGTGSTLNNDLLSRAESVSLTTFSGSARQAVLIGQLDCSVEAQDVDCYSFQSNGNPISVQLHTNSNAALTFELYSSNSTSATPLAYASNVDEFTTVLNSFDSQSRKYYLRVHSNDEALVSESTLYTLTITEGCTVGTASEVSSSLINDLSTGVCLGQTEGYYETTTENSLNISGELIRSMDSDGSHMAIVSRSNTAKTTTLRFYEYTNSQWEELDSTLLPIENCTGTGVSVSVLGNRVLLGDSVSGSAFIFTWNGDSIETTELTVSGISSESGFGTSVQLTENAAFVSAPASGKVYVFSHSQGTWSSSPQILQPEGGQTLTDFGLVLAWDAENSRLCVSSPATNTLYFYTPSEDGFALESILNETSAGNETITGFGTAVALEGNWLAVTCSNSGQKTVRIFHLEKSTGTSEKTWVFSQELTNTSKVISSNFGNALSFADGQLAIASNMEVESDSAEETKGSVYLYRFAPTLTGTEWQKVTAFKHTETNAFGKTVCLNSTNLEILDSMNHTVYTLTNFTAGDTWNLNISKTSEVTLSLSLNSGSEFPSVLIEGPDGSILDYTQSSKSGSVQITFMPEETGVHKIRLYSSLETVSYALQVTSGSVTYVSEVPVVLEPEELSHYITVEYPQQVLVASLADATATFSDDENSVYTLEAPQIVNGNQVVWHVPDSVSNGTYTLNVTGLTNISGDALQGPTDYEYEYSSQNTLYLTDAGSSEDESAVQRGRLLLEITDTSKAVTVTIPVTQEQKNALCISLSGIPVSKMTSSYNT